MDLLIQSNASLRIFFANILSLNESKTIGKLLDVIFFNSTETFFLSKIIKTSFNLKESLSTIEITFFSIYPCKNKES